MDTKLKDGTCGYLCESALAGSPMLKPRRDAMGLRNWSAVPLRLIVGYGFMAHGYAKLERGPAHFIGILEAIGIPAPDIMAWATIMVELVGGLAVLLGAFITWMSLPMAAILIVASFTVHLPNGFSSIKLQAITAAGAQFGQPGYEADLLYLACLAALVLGGAGPFAVDSARARRSRGRAESMSARSSSSALADRFSST